MKEYTVNKRILIISIVEILLLFVSVNVKVEAVEQRLPFKRFKERQKTIIVDPGHNYGNSDTGARAKHDEIVYIERDLNMAVSVALKYELEKLGYNVILTRESWQRDTSSLDDSLNKRVDIANISNADFFISIHHDANKNKDMCGVSAFYSSWKSAIDEGEEVPGYCCSRYGEYEFTMSLAPTREAIKGKELGISIVNELSNQLGINNIGAHDRDLRVTKATKIPAILVECGFITNPEEAKICADVGRQKTIAKIIADAIGNYILILHN